MRQMLVVLAALAVSVGCGRSAVSENPASPVAAAAEAAETAAPVAGTSSVPATPSYREVTIPAGTAVTGAVTSAERSGRVKGRARIALRFTSLQHGGSRYDIQTQPITRVAPATKAKDATKIGIGAGAGAAIGALLGGGSGAAKGAAIGGAGGTGVVLATRGKEVQLGSGTNLTTKLTAPLTVRVPA